MGKTALESLKELHAIQGNDGTWNYSEYMWGIYNGLELAVATLEDREPAFKKRPKSFIVDKDREPQTVKAGYIKHVMGVSTPNTKRGSVNERN